MGRGARPGPFRPIAPVALLVGSACSLIPGAGDCRPFSEPVALPPEVAESSGLAWGTDPDLLWTHDDGAVPWVFGVDRSGALVSKVRLASVEPRDLEDMATGACGAGTCLYLADTGDNALARDSLLVYRIREPAPDDSVAAAEPFPVVLPDGPRDVEAVFVLPDERLYLVSKGRSHPVTVYRYPGPLRPDSTVTLEEVQRLSSGPRVLPRQVTGAAASSSGATIVLRTYETLRFYRLEADTLAEADRVVNLRSLREAQGEAVALGGGGLVAVSSEAGPVSELGSMALLVCRDVR